LVRPDTLPSSDRQQIIKCLHLPTLILSSPH
jgi:hypothetical protein